MVRAPGPRSPGSAFRQFQLIRCHGRCVHFGTAQPDLIRKPTKPSWIHPENFAGFRSFRRVTFSAREPYQFGCKLRIGLCELSTFHFRAETL